MPMLHRVGKENLKGGNMSVLSESAKLLTHYDMVWAKKHGIAKKDIKKSLNLIWEVSQARMVWLCTFQAGREEGE